jgi:hypothetical protein
MLVDMLCQGQAPTPTVGAVRYIALVVAPHSCDHLSLFWISTTVQHNPPRVCRNSNLVWSGVELCGGCSLLLGWWVVNEAYCDLFKLRPDGGNKDRAVQYLAWGVVPRLRWYGFERHSVTCVTRVAQGGGCSKTPPQTCGGLFGLWTVGPGRKS